MELKAALLLNQMPQVTSVEIYHNMVDYSPSVKAVAEAVTFARAAQGIAQVLIYASTPKFKEVEYKKFIQALLDSLQIEGESLKANLKETHAKACFLLEITSRKEK